MVADWTEEPTAPIPPMSMAQLIGSEDPTPQPAKDVDTLPGICGRCLKPPRQCECEGWPNTRPRQEGDPDGNE